MAHEQMVDEANCWSVEVPVVDAHGAWGRDRMLLGRVAEEVTRTAGVLAVRGARPEDQR